MKGDFRTLLRRYCTQSSILGLKYFYIYPDPVSRCFWAVSLLWSVGMSFYLGRLLYGRFADMPTRLTIENQHQPITSLPHPAITICSPNQMTISSMNHLKKTFVDGNLTLNLEQVLPLTLGLFERTGNRKSTPELAQLQALLDLNRHNIPDFLGMMAQSCSRFLKYCYMGHREYPDCGALFKPLLTTFGFCCAHNSIYEYKIRKGNVLNPDLQNYMMKGSGLGQALTVIADIEPDNAVDETLLNAGAIKVMYTDRNEFPAEDEMSLLDPESGSHHVLQATYTYCSDDVAAMPIDRCLFDHERSLRFFRKYRNSDCDHLCFAHALHRRCGCWPFYLPHLPSGQACDLNAILCILTVKVSMAEWLQDEACECPRDCESRQYRADVILGNLHGMPYMVQPFPVKFNKTTTVMQFYFGRPIYTVQKQETVMSIATLVSNLGGVFGLFLGCSCMSLIEIFFFIKSAVRNYIRSR